MTIRTYNNATSTPSTTPTNMYFVTIDATNNALNSMVLSNNSLQINGALNVSNIVLNPAGTITFPSSLPTTTSTNAGLGITWNDPASGVGSGTGRTNFINYAQGGIGGFTFTTANSTTAPITNMTITPTSTSITGNTTITGSLSVSNGLSFNAPSLVNTNKISNLNNIYFDNAIVTADKIVLYNGGTRSSSYSF